MKNFNKGFLEHMSVYHKNFGTPNVDISEGDKGLEIHIYTENLHLKNSKSSDVDKYFEHIHGDLAVMKTYGHGNGATKSEVASIVKRWEDRAINKNPFVGFSVETLDEKDFSGLMILGGSDEKNSAEVACATSTRMWNKHYTTEAAGSVVFDYSKTIIDSSKYKLPSGEDFIRIVSTALAEGNPASNKMLCNAGFQVYKTEEKFGAMRNFYELSVVEPIGLNIEDEIL